MAAGSPPHYSVGTGYHIDIKVQIDLKRSKNHIVQTVDVSALIHRVSVFGCGYFKMSGVVFNRLHRGRIKALGIHNPAHKALF